MTDKKNLVLEPKNLPPEVKSLPDDTSSCYSQENLDPVENSDHQTKIVFQQHDSKIMVDAQLAKKLATKAGLKLSTTKAEEQPVLTSDVSAEDRGLFLTFAIFFGIIAFTLHVLNVVPWPLLDIPYNDEY